MTIRYTCTGCSRELAVTEQRAGSSYICPECGCETKIPVPEAVHQRRQRIAELRQAQQQRKVTAEELEELAKLLDLEGDTANADVARTSLTKGIPVIGDSKPGRPLSAAPDQPDSRQTFMGLVVLVNSTQIGRSFAVSPAGYRQTRLV